LKYFSASKYCLKLLKWISVGKKRKEKIVGKIYKKYTVKKELAGRKVSETLKTEKHIRANYARCYREKVKDSKKGRKWISTKEISEEAEKVHKSFNCVKELSQAAN
jgi:hypothetical protein